MTTSKYIATITAPESIISEYLEAFKEKKADNPTSWAKSLGYPIHVLPRKAEKLGITLPKRETNLCQLDKVINWNECIDLLNGHILGDGSLLYPKKNRNPAISSTSCKYQEYLSWLKTKLPVYANQPIYRLDSYDNRTNKIYTRYWMKSKSSLKLSEYREIWYPKGKKRLPPNIKITPEGLLIFYLEDGCVHSKYAIYLAVHDFTADEIETLKELISLAINAKVTVCYEYNIPVKLYIPSKSIYNFYSYIGKCPVKCYEYKWLPNYR